MSSLVAIAPAVGALSVRAPPIGLETLSGRPVVGGWGGAPTVMLFWRADCAPCRLELGHLGSYRAAASPMKLELVGLQSAGELRAGLRSAGLDSDSSLRTSDPPDRVLSAWGGQPPRLPLAVALDGTGRICARHSGLIGTEQLQAWARTCGGAHARG
ncbi:MAG: TlpA disulfide reductase family protein [Caulobacteraceae bacterium]